MSRNADPNSDSEATVALSRLGGHIRWLVICYVLALAAGGMASTLFWPALLAAQPALASARLSPGTLGFGGRIAALAILLVTALPALVAASEALALCHLMRQGRLFTAAVPVRLRRMGWALVATGAAQPLGGALLSLTVISFTSGGDYRIALTLSPDYVGVAVIGAVIVAVAAAAREAVRLAEENARFV